MLGSQRQGRAAFAGAADSGIGAGRLSRAGLNSTGLEVLHSSHQCLWALSRRFRIPQLSQTKTSFLTLRLVSSWSASTCQPLFVEKFSNSPSLFPDRMPGLHRDIKQTQRHADVPEEGRNLKNEQGQGKIKQDGVTFSPIQDRFRDDGSERLVRQ